MSGEILAHRYRTIWISDIHLGTRGCKADHLLDFLRHTESEHLYLVGDIVDGWRLKKSWYCPQPYDDVVQKLLRKARKGTREVFVPANHDEVLRDYTGLVFGDWAYNTVQSINYWMNQIRRILGFRYWSLSTFLKYRVKNAVQFVSRFEEVVAVEARKRGADGVVCGHIHHAEMREMNGVLYCNDGDWV